ncbi:hypothetical protein [Cohnella yongneupensis]|uniref:Uncharacterized protein n=1 Tax=Cohnella yongneupensis TaxID=425006 RepID=A0ABW0QXN6_9BACL
MNKRLLILLVAALMTVSAPLMVAAATPDGDKHNEPRPSLDWKAYPAEIQALKVQLDSIRDQQKGLFAQMKNQHDQIREAQKSLNDNQRKAMKKNAQKIIEQMKATRDSIHTLRDQKRTSWENFHSHSKDKLWSDAKTDLQTIVKQKQQILDNQRNILKLQQQLIVLMKPTESMHYHAEE